jgi:hypothetical protein
MPIEAGIWKNGVSDIQQNTPRSTTARLPISTSALMPLLEERTAGSIGVELVAMLEVIDFDLG